MNRNLNIFTYAGIKPFGGNIKFIVVDINVANVIGFFLIADKGSLFSLISFPSISYLASVLLPDTYKYLPSVVMP